MGRSFPEKTRRSKAGGEKQTFQGTQGAQTPPWTHEGLLLEDICIVLWEAAALATVNRLAWVRDLLEKAWGGEKLTGGLSTLRGPGNLQGPSPSPAYLHPAPLPMPLPPADE